MSFRRSNSSTTFPGSPASAESSSTCSAKPWPAEKTYWKNAWKGGVPEPLLHRQTGCNPSLRRHRDEVAARYGYPIADIGMYIQPIEHNRACHVEFNFFYDPDDAAEKAVIGALYREAAPGSLMDEGAFFYKTLRGSGHHGVRSGRKLHHGVEAAKKVFDPKNVMNPGNLCF